MTGRDDFEIDFDPDLETELPIVLAKKFLNSDISVSVSTTSVLSIKI